MPDYTQGKIYKIVSANVLPYIGSTTQSLERRLQVHRAHYTHWMSGKGHYMTSYEVLMHEDAVLELIENFPCNSKDELLARETYWQRQIPCCNAVLSKRSNHEYYLDHHDRVCLRQKEYYIANRDVICQRQNEYNDAHHEQRTAKATCECGAVVVKRNLPEHRKREKHNTLMAMKARAQTNPPILKIVPSPQEQIPEILPREA